MNSIDVQDWEILPNDGFPDDGGSNNQQYTLPTKPSIMTYLFSTEKSVETRVHPEMADRGGHEPISTDKVPTEDEEDSVPQVFFKKIKETEFVDNIVDSPRTSRPDFHFEKGKLSGNSKADLEERRDSFNIWILSLFGMAAAGVCIIISWGNNNKQHQHKQKQHRRA